MRYLLLLVLLIPESAFAQGLVTCQAAGTCSFCALLEMINGIVDWIVIIASLFSILILAYAGFLLIFSQGDRSALEKGKQLFFQSIIGILIMLAGWTIVDTVIKLTVGGEFGQWNEVQCGAGEFAAGTAREYSSDLRFAEIEVAEGDGSVVTVHTGGHVGIDGESTSIVACDESQMVSVTLFGVPIRIHQNYQASLQRIDAAWRAQGGNESFYRVTSVGGYNCRQIAGSGAMSKHSYGLAVDINPAQNPHLGSECRTDMPPAFRQLFIDEGWGWGCNWTSSKDAMHFSKAPNEGGR